MSKNNYLYAREKFILAVDCLATSKDDIKSRLEDAYCKIKILREEDLPRDLRKDFVLIISQISNNRLFYKWGKTCEKIAKKYYI